MEMCLAMSITDLRCTCIYFKWLTPARVCLFEPELITRALRRLRRAAAADNLLVAPPNFDDRRAAAVADAILLCTYFITIIDRRLKKFDDRRTFFGKLWNKVLAANAALPTQIDRPTQWRRRRALWPTNNPNVRNTWRRVMRRIIVRGMTHMLTFFTLVIGEKSRRLRSAFQMHLRVGRPDNTAWTFLQCLW